MNTNKQVLYLSYDGLCDPLGQSQILPYLFKLCADGYMFTVISFEKPTGLKKHKQELARRISAFPIKWIPMKYSKNPPVLSTIYDLFRMKSKVRKELRNHTFDLIHVRSYLPMLIAEKYCHSHKVIFDMRGLWPDERKESGLWPINRPLFRKIYSFFRGKESQFISHAHAIVSLTHEGVSALKERYPNAKIDQKVTVIPCCADEAKFDPNIINSDVRRELGLRKEAKVLIHVGSVGTWYRLDQEIMFFNILQEKDHNWHFLILTQEVEKAKNEVLSLAKSPESIRVMSTSYDQVPSFLSIANLSILLIQPSFSKRASSPVKLGESLMMGVPVVVNAEVGDNIDFLNGGKNGLIIYDGDEFHDVLKDFVIKDFNSNDIRRFALENVSLEKGYQLYSTLYHEILQ